ncbi:hypothetical protein [Streptomyces lanatus]|uniref:Histidine kinase n=1 Tax=Streptomyces lanatus TaxID=66900 RepID=A0ABV1XXL1_9ACTN|nr:hypothetical protein [Streptomyces lanatus]GHH17921.1 hypothetical protein GCM10018780_61910 [Streptomyces lanatus]
MNLTPYVDSLRREFLAAAEAVGMEVLGPAERLVAPLEASVRLTLLSALSAAADEISRELVPGAVDIRLRGGDPGFVVLAAPAEPEFGPLFDIGAEPPAGDGQGTPARINFRPPGPLKARIEEAAGREGLSVNAWLVRAATITLDSGARRTARRAPSERQNYTGWVR